MIRNALRSWKGRAAAIGSAAVIAAAVGAATASASPASASPSKGTLCGAVAPGTTSSWCALRASGTKPSDTRANGQVTVSSDGTMLTVNTEDNGQGGGSLGAAPASSEACVYPAPQAPREARLDNAKKCAKYGGVLVTWSNTNSSGSFAVPSSLVGTDFFVYVAAHPSGKNHHGSAYHGTFEVDEQPGTQVPLGTVGGIGLALVAGGALIGVQRRRHRLTASSASAS